MAAAKSKHLSNHLIIRVSRCGFWIAIEGRANALKPGCGWSALSARRWV